MSLRYRFGVFRYKLRHYLGFKTVQTALHILPPPIIQFTDNKKIIILSPHPDDEVLGCGGLIAKATSEGNAPYVVIVSNGNGSFGEDWEDKALVAKERSALTDKAAGCLGLPLSQIVRLNVTDTQITRMLENPEMVSQVITDLKKLQPQVIVAPSEMGDFPDHIATHKLGKLLYDSLVHDGKDVELWNYCVWAWFCHPYRLVGKILRGASVLKLNQALLSKKRAAIREYVTPMGPCGIPWSGTLDEPFLRIHRWNREVYYRPQHM